MNEKTSIVKFSDGTIAVGDTSSNSFADFIIDIMEENQCIVVDVSLFTNSK